MRRHGRVRRSVVALAVGAAALLVALQVGAPATAADVGSGTAAGAPVLPWASVTRGHLTSCGIRVDHSGWCWGFGLWGQVGSGPRSVAVDRPRQLPGTWLSIAVGDVTTCGVQLDHTGWCWGHNTSGTVGDGTTHHRADPTRLPGTWSSITLGSDTAAGARTACGVQTDGSGWCWGENASGQVGDGGSSDATVPTLLPGSGWASFSLVAQTTCGTRTDGSAWCWGDNRVGLVGDGTLVTRRVPTRLPGSGWSRVTLANLLACGVRADHSGWCWGSNHRGQVGDGTTTDRLAPSRVPGAWSSIAVDPYYLNASCGLQVDGSAWCWGRPLAGELGQGDTPRFSATPLRVPGGPWTALGVGTLTACALSGDGSVSCWGLDIDGAVGVGRPTVIRVGVPTVLRPAQVASLSVGYRGGCLTRSVGTAWCWGTNQFGQVGDASTTTRFSPVQVGVAATS